MLALFLALVSIGEVGGCKFCKYQFTCFFSSALFPTAAPTLLEMAEVAIPCPPPYMPIPYGCYCGPTSGDPGVDPVDDFDGLCKKHDGCYAKVEEDVEGCKGIVDEYLAPYKWKKKDGKVRSTHDDFDRKQS